MSKLPLPPLSRSNILVTGGSRDIGGGIVLALGKEGGNIISVFRSKPERAQKIKDELNILSKTPPELLQADITSPEGQESVFNALNEKFKNNLDMLVLCASGSTIEINVDANMALVDKFIKIREEKMQNGEELKQGTIVFLQSEPGHFHHVIDGVFGFLEYYRTKVGPAKRAGEDALRDRLAKMDKVGIRAVVVCPPEVTDTFNMKLFELQEKQARAKSRELSAMLGTKPYVTIQEVAERVVELVQKDDIAHGHTELFVNRLDTLTMLTSIYGEEAVYLHTLERADEGQGIGRLIVNPSLWKRDQEPSFAGEVKNQNEDGLVSILQITKDHARGHFREDLACVLPGHKSVRTAAIALGQLRGIDENKVFLKKYQRVKFLNPVLPGQALMTTVSNSGDARQSVEGKATMEITGMVIEKREVDSESALLLDQLIEVSAQTVGMYVLNDLKKGDLLPLFHSTGEAEMFGSLAPGNCLLIKAQNVRVVKTGNMNIFSSDLEIAKLTIETVTENGDIRPRVAKEEKVATVKSLQGLLLPEEEVLKKIT